MYDCLDGVYDHEADDRCIHSSPGHDPNFMFLCGMEPIRIGCVYIAFLMLVCGYAFGGKEEVLALAHVRIDAAPVRRYGADGTPRQAWHFPCADVAKFKANWARNRTMVIAP